MHMEAPYTASATPETALCTLCRGLADEAPKTGTAQPRGRRGTVSPAVNPRAAMWRAGSLLWADLHLWDMTKDTKKPFLRFKIENKCNYRKFYNFTLIYICDWIKSKWKDGLFFKSKASSSEVMSGQKNI